MPKDMIRYDVLAQEAFRGLVKKVLAEVAHAGLPGEHHFYIIFDTRAPGVRISARLKERYPDEMTIVIQHQYWELVVNETSFEIGLSFSGVPEKLVVPFASVRGFFDPSVEFAVQFPLVDESGNAADMPEEGPLKAIGPASGEAKISARPPRGQAAKEPAAKPEKPAAKAPEEPKPAEEASEERASGPTVVSLDAFRKKP
ncbi:SspB family protein [Pleomorphomonas sp. NRK KF1]|uniref:SspB family protein n=1 Tax=Pleomorphomonas sp. NRK KF1 TaxID=2943000 RepID=UPI0020443E78|nr:SspB family protein [Pleomorphomonas sp. NRK KF1]MCM5555755.1 SspB family protein [Pleomorphomonas sp. NRK KF1]